MIASCWTEKVDSSEERVCTSARSYGCRPDANQATAEVRELNPRCQNTSLLEAWRICALAPFQQPMPLLPCLMNLALDNPKPSIPPPPLSSRITSILYFKSYNFVRMYSKIPAIDFMWTKIFVGRYGRGINLSIFRLRSAGQ